MILVTAVGVLLLLDQFNLRRSLSVRAAIELVHVVNSTPVLRKQKGATRAAYNAQWKQQGMCG